MERVATYLCIHSFMWDKTAERQRETETQGSHPFLGHPMCFQENDGKE